MKSKYILAFVVPVLLAAGCRKTIDPPTGQEVPAASGTEYRYQGYAVDEIDFGATKTWLTPDYKVAWIDGDQVRCRWGGLFTAAILGDEVTHAFLAPNDEDQEMVADGTGYFNVFYPSEVVKSDRVTLELPKTQYYNARNILSVNPMYAKDTCEVLQFHNVSGLLQIRLKGTATVKSIELWADKAISGSFSIQEYEEEGVTCYKAVTSGTPSEGSAESRLGVTLDCTKPSATGTAYPEGGIVLSKEGTLFYLSLPDSTYNWMKVRVTDKDGYVSYKKIDEEIKIKRNTVYYTEFTPVWGVQLAEGGPVWSLRNLGAKNEWEYGDWYCWAGTEPLYRTCGRTYDGTDSKYEVTFTPDSWKGGFSEGYVKENAAFYDRKASTPDWYKYTATDGKTVLDPQDDPVTMTMGPSWRIPTAAEIGSLSGSASTRSNPAGTETIKGLEVSGLNGAKLFIPYAGYVDGIELKDAGTALRLWSNTCAAGDNATGSAGSGSATYSKWLGFSVRGVCPTASTGEY